MRSCRIYTVIRLIWRIASIRTSSTRTPTIRPTQFVPNFLVPGINSSQTRFRPTVNRPTSHACEVGRVRDDLFRDQLKWDEMWVRRAFWVPLQVFEKEHQQQDL